MMEGQWPHRDSRFHPTLPPPLPDSGRSSIRTFRHSDDDDHFYSPYPRPPTRRSLARSNPTPKYSRSLSPSSPPHFYGPPNYDFVSPPSSPPSLPRDDRMWKKINPLINAVEEEIIPPFHHDSQDSVVPSMQKMKICNLVE